MTESVIAALTAAVCYLAARWRGSVTEAAGLRAQIAGLKRQLSRRGA